MKLLPGVDPEYLHSALALALYIGDECARANGFEIIVTHLGDGKHGTNSLHPKGRAADIRTKGIDRNSIANTLAQWKAKLGDNGALYDILWEAQGTDNEHIHIEYDNKQYKKGVTPSGTGADTAKPTTVNRLVRPK